MQKTIIGVKTVRGMAALWESGGNDGQRGVARLIAKADGSMPVSLFINYKEDNINGNQALVAVTKLFCGRRRAGRKPDCHHLSNKGNIDRKGDKNRSLKI